MDNKLLPFVEAFIPSRQKWVFNWLWTKAYPSLLDEDALAKTCIILVDQDELNYETIQSTIQSQLAEGLDCCVSAKDGDISATFLLRERPRNIPSDQVLPFYHQTHTVTCTKQTASDGVEYWCFTCRCSEVSQC